MTQPLEALLARVEGATGPDREIDLAICVALVYPGDLPTGLLPGWSVYLSESHVSERVMVRVRSDDGEDGPLYSWPRPYLTASLDAALALVERSGVAGIDAAQLLHQALEDMANGGWRDDQALASQIALYLIAALLRRMIDARAV